MTSTNDLEPWQQELIASISPPTYPTTFPFARLPDELQQRVLEFTDLVLPCWYITDQFLEPYQPQGLVVCDGKLDIPRRLTCCPECFLSETMQWCESPAAIENGCSPPLAESCVWFELPTSLLYVSRKLSIMAREVLLSSNRVVLQLGGNPRATLEFLQSQSPGGLLYHVKSLEFSFTPEFAGIWVGYSDQVREGWSELVDFVFENFHISNMHLSLEALSLLYNVDENVNLDNTDDCSTFWRGMKRFYDLIVNPFVSTGEPEAKEPWAELKSFHVYFPAWLNLEPVYEKMVKGPAYDSYKTGKLPLARDTDELDDDDGAKRFHNLPHGWEWPDQEDVRWFMDWDPRYIHDVEDHPTMLEVMKLSD